LNGLGGTIPGAISLVPSGTIDRHFVVGGDEELASHLDSFDLAGMLANTVDQN
jgi:hypothetical protein